MPAPPVEPLSRRSLLKAAAAVVPAAGAAAAVAQDGTVRPDATTGREAIGGGVSAGPHPGVIVRQWEPRNLEYPLPSLDGPVTPTNQFYVRSHFPVPEADAETWTLTVDGPDFAQRSFTLADLEALGTEEKTVTMECAGNGRIFLVPQPSGLLWETGGVGTAVWRGTPLQKVLARCFVKEALPRVGGVDALDRFNIMRFGGPDPWEGKTPKFVPGIRMPFSDAERHVQLRGADNGKLSKYPAPLHYSRGLPMTKALDDVLLATHMNGEPLPPHHGYPLRAIVPGWYGAASVKWLDKITVTNEPDRGFFSTFDYATFERTPAGEQLVPLTGMVVKSSLARPARGERVKAGEPVVVRGAAWAGERAVAKVEFSADGGASWADAELIDDPRPLVWSRWWFDWTPPKPGSYTLMSRATDTAGDTQPSEHDPLRRAYMVNFTVPVGVEAR